MKTSHTFSVALVALFAANANATVTTGEQAALCAGAFAEAGAYLESAPSSPDIEHTKQAFHVKGTKFLELVKTEMRANRISPEQVGTLMDNVMKMSQTQPGYREGIIKECLVKANALASNSVATPDTNASYVKHPSPEYPNYAKMQGWQGKVILKIQVLANGHVGQASIAQSSGYDLLDTAAYKAVKTWTFNPATRGGNSVDSIVNVPVNFGLK
jgi:TonB family protein